MCIKIVSPKGEASYDANKPIEEQIAGSSCVVVNYEPADPTVDKFLDEVERLCKNGISANLNIKFNHNNNLTGVRIRNEMRKLAEDLDVNEIIKMMATTQAETDRKLEEIANLCMSKPERVKH